MKVLLVNKFHHKKGGSETYYFTLADVLRSSGHQVIFFAMEDEKNLPCQQSPYFVSNASVLGDIKSKLNMLMHIAYSMEAYRKMKSLLEAEKPDLVILNLVHKQITLSILDAIREYDVHLPVFWTMHDLIAVCPSYTMIDGHGDICEKCLQGSFVPCVKNRCIKGSLPMSILSCYEADYIRRRRWYHQVDLFICPSEFYRQKLTAGDFTRSRIVTMRNPLPLDTTFGKGNMGDYLLYFGRLSPEKGVKTLIDAANQTGRRLVILGTGPLEARLREYASHMPNVEFKGFQTGQALQDYVANSRCVVLPSEWYENGPYSAMEAMAAGKPLIVSNLGGLPEMVEPGVNGYVYGGGSDALAQCIEDIFALDAQAYGEMAQNAQQRAKTMFDPQAYVQQLMQYYAACKE